MKNSVLATILYLGIFIKASTVAAQEPDLLLCYESAWKVESATVFGDKTTAAGKLEKYTKAMDLQRHRMYLLAIESAEGSEVTMFEFDKDDKAYKVTTYNIDSMGDLMKEVNAAILASKGQKCVGKICNDILGTNSSNKKPEDARKVLSADSGFPSFKKVIAEFDGDFLQISVIVLC